MCHIIFKYNCFRENNFKCDTGLCIKKEKLCDGIRDCDDGSDETYRNCANKTCLDNFYQCAYGACTTTFVCVDESLPPGGQFFGPLNSHSVEEAGRFPMGQSV